MSERMTMRVYEIDEDIHRDWCAATSHEEAIRVWRAEYGYGDDVPAPSVRELRDVELDSLRVHDDDDESPDEGVTFREELERTWCARIFASSEV